MDRNALAKELMLAALRGGRHYSVKQAFKDADEFIALCSPPKPPKCEHNRIYEGPVIPLVGQCLDCGVMTQEPAPKREAREWWIRYPNPPESSWGAAHNSVVPEVWADTAEHQEVFPNDEWIKVREILP